MIDVTVPAAVRIMTSDTTLSDTIFSIVPGKRFRMLMLISLGFNEREQLRVDDVGLRCDHTMRVVLVGLQCAVL